MTGPPRWLRCVMCPKVYCGSHCLPPGVSCARSSFICGAHDTKTSRSATPHRGRRSGGSTPRAKSSRIGNVLTEKTQTDSVVINEADDNVTTYCVCRGVSAGFMIECSRCKEWFHGVCMGLKKDEVDASATFVCPRCDKDKIPRMLKAEKSSGIGAKNGNEESFSLGTRRVLVFDRAARIVLSGSRSPLVSELEGFLTENPQCEVILVPGIVGTNADPSTWAAANNYSNAKRGSLDWLSFVGFPEQCIGFAPAGAKTGLRGDYGWKRYDNKLVHGSTNPESAAVLNLAVKCSTGRSLLSNESAAELLKFSALAPVTMTAPGFVTHFSMSPMALWSPSASPTLIDPRSVSNVSLPAVCLPPKKRRCLRKNVSKPSFAVASAVAGD